MRSVNTPVINRADPEPAGRAPRDDHGLMTALALTVVMPAYNEAEILESSVKSVVDGLRERGGAFELIIVENGSTDGTAAIADALAASEPEVRAEHCADADYGRALRAGLIAANGDAIVNFDTDFFDLGFLDAAVPLVVE